MKNLNLFVDKHEEKQDKLLEVKQVYEMLYKFTNEKLKLFFQNNILLMIFKKFAEDEMENLPQSYQLEISKMLELT